MSDSITKNIEEHRHLIETLANDSACLETIKKAAEAMIDALKGGGKILLCGNGGSAADAQHIAAELVGRFGDDRPALWAEALTVNSSSLTAIANDLGYERVFERQVEAKGRKGDVLVGITTSGHSENVLRALVKAKSMEMVTVVLTGEDKLSPAALTGDVTVAVPSKKTPRIQEAHLLIGHIVCEMIEEALF